MSQEVCFVRCGKSDLEELVRFEQEVFPHPWTREQFRLSLDQNAFHIFGFRQQDTIVAYCSFVTVVDEAEILNIAVRTELQQQGMGERLLRLVLNICRRLGVERVTLESRPSNTAALRLYQKLGFGTLAVRSSYYPDTGEDAIVLQLDMTREWGPVPPAA
ncbi:MAG: ribosomal protein S18-alanine N-acetyltransferase [Desulfohalobiaceae bacterium]